MATYSTEGQLIQTVASLQSNGIRNDVLHALRRDWPADRLVGMLVSSDADLLQAVLTTLGLTGVMSHSKYVASLLRHREDEIAQTAEQALWHIWMRGGTPWGNDVLRRAVAEIEAGNFTQADELLENLTLSEPTFAEGQHQAGLTASMLGRNDDALAYYRQALRLNPYHFTSAEGLGQIYFDRQQYVRAREYYAYAVQIHPRLAEAQEMLVGLDRVIGAAGAGGHA